MSYLSGNERANNAHMPRKGNGWRNSFLLAILAAVCFLVILLAVRPARADNPNFTVQHPFGTYAAIVTVGDVDGDGALDIIASSPYYGSSHNEVYLNDGRGNFPSVRRFGTGSDVTKSLAVGDVDGDGNLDIVVGNNGQSAVYLNDGAGNFYSGPVICGVSGGVRCFGTGSDATQSVATGDVDGDGDLDLIVGNDGQQSAIYLNDGAGNFYSGPLICGVTTSVRCFGTNSQAVGSVAVGDLDNDGDLDIATAPVSYRGDEQGRVYLNDGMGNFDHAADTCDAASSLRCFGSPLDGARNLVVGDVDGDADLDLIADYSGYYGTIIYLNDGLGNFPNGTVTCNVTVGVRCLHAESTGTLSVAVGDLDDDGDLDLVVGTDAPPDDSQLNLVYMNDGTGNFALGSRFGTLLDTTAQVAIADMDGDGNLDLVAANGYEQNFIYLNNGVGSFTTSSSFGSGAQSITMGDMDGDGALDIVASNGTIFLNDGTGGFSTSHSYGGGGESVAVGDVNSDGALDIVASDGAVFLNDGTGNFYNGPVSCGVIPDVRCFGSATDDTRSVALGDVDSDGNLDIVVGNARRYDTVCQCYVGAQSMIFVNDGVGNFHSGSVPCGAIPDVRCFGSATDDTRNVILGDVDGDGDLDLIVGKYGQSAVYLNDGRGYFPIRHNFGAVMDRIQSLAAGDLDGDGDLDIVAGMGLSFPLHQNVIYLNDGAGNFAAGHTFGPLENDTFGVAVSDVDGDGDMDIAVANGIEDLNKPNEIYLNDGTGNFPIQRNFGNGLYRMSMALGDVDNDGDLDIAIGKDTYNIVYLNGLAVSKRLTNNPPQVALTRPGPTRDANFFSTPAILGSPTIPLTYTLFDPEGDPVRFIRAFYSPDGGGHWLPAVAASGTITANLATSPSGVIHTFSWDTFANGFFGQSDDVVFRIVAYPGVQPQPNAVPGPYQRPYASATTFPFRVRGTQVRVRKQDGMPAVGAQVYRLPAGQSRDAQPFAAGGQLFHTDSQGYLQGRGELKLGDQLIALLPITSTESYTLYDTSAAPNANGLSATTVLTSGVQTLTVSSANPLVLFNLDVSLEWDARKDTQFMTQLQYDLRRTSEFLYDWTNGQAALGHVTLYHDRQKWNDAHLRIYATNRMRPNAVQGGIVTSVITDPISLRATNPVLPAITYAPGQVRVGPIWNRYGDSNGNLGEDWPRALAHELGHFALFLDDNYLGLQSGVLVPVDGCPGAMSDPYRDDYSEFHPAADWLPGCHDTLSNQGTGRADWSTITTFYPWLHAPTVDFTHVLTGPTTLPLEITQIQEAPVITPSTTVDAPIFLLSQGGQRVQPGTSARAFLFQDSPDDADTAPDRLIDLGRPTLDQLLARGARVGDRLCLYELAAHRLGCTTVSPSDRQLPIVTTAQWQPDISLTPVTSRTLTLMVGGVPGGLALGAQLFAADGRSLPPIALAPTATGSYRGAFTWPLETNRPPPYEGYVYVWVNEPAPRREVVTDYALRGNPGSKWARAPRSSPGSKWARAPLLSSDGQVILFGDDLDFAEGAFYTLQAASSLPAAPSWATEVGQAYRLSASASAPPLQGTSISFNYLGSEVPPGEESGLRVYFWNGSRWLQLPTTLDLYHNTASAPAQGPGIYALMSSVVLPFDQAGWNLIAYPAPGKQAMPAALASIDGSYTAVYGYDPNDTHNAWKVYDVGVEPQWAPLVNDLKELEYGHGYWINVTEPITALLKGGTSPTLLTNNAIGNLTLPPATYYGIVPGVASTAKLTVQARINGHLCGEADTQALTIDGKALTVFVIDVHAAGAGTDAGCGTPGQQVTIAFLDGDREVGQLMTTWDNNRVHEIGYTPRRLYLPMIVRGR